MKDKFKGSLFLAVIFFLLGMFGFFENFLGIGLHWGLFSFSLDTTLIIGSIWGIVCSYIAYRKNRNPNSAFFVGLFFTFLGFLYYLITKPGMNEKEKELHDWEIQKKYKQMMKERKEV